MKIIWPPWDYWPYAAIALGSLAVMVHERETVGAVAFATIVFIIAMLKCNEIHKRGESREKPKPAFGSSHQKPDRKP